MINGEHNGLDYFLNGNDSHLNVQITDFELPLTTTQDDYPSIRNTCGVNSVQQNSLKATPNHVRF